MIFFQRFWAEVLAREQAELGRTENKESGDYNQMCDAGQVTLSFGPWVFLLAVKFSEDLQILSIGISTTQKEWNWERVS